MAFSQHTNQKTKSTIDGITSFESSLVCECASGTYEAEVREGQTAQAADPGDLVVLQVENGEAAAFLQACDLAETVVWQSRRVKSITLHATDLYLKKKKKTSAECSQRLPVRIHPRSSLLRYK